MNFLKKTSLLLTLIIILAAILRLPLLDKYPQGVTVDEAGQAYSAYSILKTGKDEWGDFLPLNPRGFGDYKPPVYMYLLVPSIGLFGLNEFATRFPSAIAGILTVWAVFLLMKQLSKTPKLGLLSALFIAISPWHVYYSRLGWESNVGLLFFILGMWLFMKALEKPQSFILSMISFGLAGLSYHSFKLIVPLMVISLITIFWKQLQIIKKINFIAPIVIVLIFSSILGYGFLFSGASRRASDQAIIKEENLSQLRQAQVEDGFPNPFNRILFNKYQFGFSKISDNYLAYFSPAFLFGLHRSESSILNFPSMGLLYIWQLPLILLGLWYLIKNKSQQTALLLSWLIIAPIPASLTQDYMHAGRAQAILPVFTIISTLGFYYIIEILKSKNTRRILLISSTLIIGLSVFWRIDNYLYHTFNKPLGGLKQGYQEMMNYISENNDKYDKFIFTKGESEPHAFVGFYTKSDPVEMQQAAQNWKKFEPEGHKFLDQIDYNLGKYEFKNIDMSRDRHNQNALIIGTEKEIPVLMTPKFKVRDIAGNVIFVVIDTNEIPD